jgi:hypothetical protein
MGVTASLLVSAVGAILIWAVTATTHGINIHTVGVILLIAGLVSFVISLFFWKSWGGFHGAASRTVVTTQEQPPQAPLQP